MTNLESRYILYKSEFMRHYLWKKLFLSLRLGQEKSFVLFCEIPHSQPTALVIRFLGYFTQELQQRLIDHVGLLLLDPVATTSYENGIPC